MSVADSVRAAAEAAVKESERKALEAAGMVYDANSGMYYDYNSGYYYDAVCISTDLWCQERNRERDRYREQVHRTQWETVLSSVSVQCEQLHTILYNPFFICLSQGLGIVSVSVNEPLI